MSIKISGILPGPTGEPAAHIGITLRAVKTSLTVITTLESNSITGTDGAYSLNVEPGQYDVLLWVDGINARNVGTITVYSDSLPGTLNNFLTALREEDGTPEIIRQLEQLRAAATAAAFDAKQSKDEATRQANFATNAAGSAAQETAELIKGAVKDDADRSEAARKGAETAQSTVNTLTSEVAQYHTEVGRLASAASASASAAAGSSNNAAQSASESEGSKNSAAQSEQSALASAESAGTSATAAAGDKAAAKGFRDEAERFAIQAKSSAESIDVSALEEQIDQKVSQTEFEEAIEGKASNQKLADGLATKLSLNGGIMEGNLVLHANGVSALDAATAGQLTGVVGDSRNLAINLYDASTTAAITANDLIVQSSSGIQYRTGPINTPINISISGIGGMYNTAPVAGFVAIYAIYNPTTQVTALYGLQHTQTTPEVFPYALPAGYTASALVSCWRTSASQLVAGMQIGREIKVARTLITSGSGNASNAQIFLNNILPPNARIGVFDCSTVTSSSNNTSVSLQTTGGTIGYNRVQNGSAIAIGTIALPINRSTAVIYVYLSAMTATPADGTWALNALGYSI